MEKSKWQNKVFFASLILGLSSLLLAIFGAYSYNKEQNKELQKGKIQAKREAMEATLEIEQELRDTQKTVFSLATAIAAGKISDKQVLDGIKKAIEQNPNLLNVGAAYRPLAYNPDVKLYAPSYVRINDKLQPVQVDKIYDYTEPKYNWFRQAFVNGAYWGEPYFWPETSLIKEPVVGFYAPFYRPQLKNEQPSGVIFAEYSVGKLKQIMSELSLGKTGYGFILAKDGTYISSPVDKYINSQTNVFETIEHGLNRELRRAINKALLGEKVEAKYIDITTGQKLLVFLRPTAVNGWVVGVVFVEDEVLPNTETRRRKIIWLSLAILLFFISLSSLLFRAYEGNDWKLWVLSSFSSVLLIVEIGVIWRIALADDTYVATLNTLLNQTAVNNLLSPQLELSKQLKQKPPLYVPTGIFVESLDFSSPSDIFVTGYIWQEYEAGIHDRLSRGFIMPDAINANDAEVSEAYRHKEGKVEVIGWYFESSLRQKFDFSTYPLDRKQIRIRLLHKDFNRQDLNRQVILVPDLTAYKALNPNIHPGVSKNIVLKGWELNKTFFEYQFNSYDTNFGIKNIAPKPDFPELYFSMVLKRAFIGPFISRVGPLTIVAMLLFSMLLISDPEKAMEVLAACAGLIFIVILDQIAVREQIIAPGIIYFEYFYFLLYLYIFLVALNAIFLIKYPDFSLVKYKNNMISKLLYWPSFLSILVVITAFVFY